MSWQNPVREYKGPPLPPAGGIDTSQRTKSSPSGDTTWENFWASLFPWEFPGQDLRTPGPMVKGKPQPLPETAPASPAEAARRAVSGATEAARKASGIDPASWQTFIKQTLTDWGIYAGFGVLLVLGLVFLVSAAGKGSPQVIIQRAVKRS